MNARKNVTPLLIITLILFYAVPANSFSDNLEIKAPDRIFTGELAIIKVTGKLPEPSSPYLRLLDHNFPCLRTGTGEYEAIVGAGLKASSGNALLELHTDRKGRPVKTVTIKIVRKRYPEEHLKVSKKMVNFRPDILKRVLADQKAVKNACSIITNDKLWTKPFIWPVNSVILSPFGRRRFFNGEPRSPHSGVDMRAPAGTPIKAANRGKAVLVRNCYLSGNTVVIDHGTGLFTLYAHMSRVNVKEGEMVDRGDIIGASGATGRATGPHLHWGVSISGIRVNPESLMKLLGESGTPGMS